MDKSFKVFYEPVYEGNGLAIRGVGLREPMPPGLVDRPVGTPDYLLMYYYDPVELSALEDLGEFDAPVLFLWEPEVRQVYGYRTAGYLHSWIHCSGEVVRDILMQSGIRSHVPYSVDVSSTMETYLGLLHDEISGHTHPDAVMVSNLFENMLRGIGRVLPDASTENAPEALIELRREIDTACEKHYTLDALAKRVHLSVPHFSAVFRRYFGVSPIDYVIRQRMRRAEYLLRNQNLRIGEIAECVGYSDGYHFSKLFKKHFGVSPRAMRKRQETE